MLNHLGYFLPIVRLHAVWSAVGMILSSIRPSVCLWGAYCGVQDRCSCSVLCLGAKEGTSYSLLQTLCCRI